MNFKKLFALTIIKKTLDKLEHAQSLATDLPTPSEVHNKRTKEEETKPCERKEGSDDYFAQPPVQKKKKLHSLKRPVVDDAEKPDCKKQKETVAAGNRSTDSNPSSSLGRSGTSVRRSSADFASTSTQPDDKSEVEETSKAPDQMCDADKADGKAFVKKTREIRDEMKKRSYADIVQEGSDRPITRSQVEKLKEEHQEEELYFVKVLQPNAWPDLDERHRLLEIRAVHEDEFSLPPDTPLCMIFEENGWEPVEMTFNERGRFHFLRLTVSSGLSLFKYKFCYSTGNEFEYEKLPGSVKVNRCLKFEGTRYMISLNVCIFQRKQYWFPCYIENMVKFLPTAEMVMDSPTAGSHSSILADIFCFVNCAKHGWGMKENHGYMYKVSSHDHGHAEIVLLNWVKKLVETLPQTKQGLTQRTLIGLGIIVSFTQENHRIGCDELSLILFNMLRIDKFDKQMCGNIYEIAKKEHDAASSYGQELPSFKDAFQFLYKFIPRWPNFEWMMTLPLYWSMTNRGKIKEEVLKRDPNKSLLYAWSSLPPIQSHDWYTVRNWLVGNTPERQEIFDIIPDVMKNSELHPWIIRTFQFVLKSAELATLILERERHPIVQHFPVESVLQQYLDEYVAGHFDKSEPAVHLCFDQYFKGALDDGLRRCSDSNRNASDQEERDSLTCQRLLDVIGKYLKPARAKNVSPTDVLWCLNTIVLKTITWTTKLHLSKEEEEKITEKLSVIHGFIAGRIGFEQLERHHIEYWGKLLDISWNVSAALAESWKTAILAQIERCLEKFCSRRNGGDRFLDFYVDELCDVSLQVDIERCLNDKAYQCVDKQLHLKVEEKKWFGSFIISLFVQPDSPRPKSRIIQVFERLFKQEYRKVGDSSFSQTSSLKLLCTWLFSAKFFELFTGCWLEYFQPKTREDIQKVSKNFEGIIRSLLKGRITVEHLSIIMENKEQFFHVCNVLLRPEHLQEGGTSKDISPHMPDKISELLDLSSSYHEKFEETKAAVKAFITVCEYANYDGMECPFEELKGKVKMNVQKLSVSDLVTVNDNGGYHSNDFFGISSQDLSEFQALQSLKESKQLFRQIFTQAVESQRDEMIHWSNIVPAWITVKGQIFDLIQQVDEGTMTVRAVLDQFRILNGKFEDIEKEIDLFYEFCSEYQDQEDDIKMPDKKNLRKNQIYHAFQLQQATETVNLLLLLRNMLNLKGNFKFLENWKWIMENQEIAELQNVPESLKIAEICSVAEENLNVLKKFMAQNQVIHWLQHKMKRVNEVKVMCDLAMISAGEDTMEIDKVSNFLGAVMGFAPLIFWVEDGKDVAETAGCKELFVRCEEVFENAKGIRKMLEKWEDTSRQLHWFKEVENFYGSVEKSSLKRAQEINEHGVYIIQKPPGNQCISMKHTVTLKLPPSTSDRNLELGLEELLELQSKLMLIAGEAEKGQQDVNKFVEVLSSVQKLAEVYVQLVSSGCMLFIAWKATVMCQGCDGLNIAVVIDEDVPPVTGSGQPSTIDKFTDILKNTLTKWEEYVSRKRTEFYQLNEYNIQQIMYLCHELANLNEMDEVPSQVHALLTSLRKRFSLDDLKLCLDDARNQDMDFENQETSLTSRDSTPTDNVLNKEAPLLNESTPEQDEMRKKMKVIDHLCSQDGYSEEQAKAAVQAEGFEDLASCQLWIIQNECDEKMVEQFSMDFDNQLGLNPEDAEVVQSVFDGKWGNTLKDVIRKLLEKTSSGGGDFFDSIKTITEGYLDETIAMNLQDHLSVDLLGKCLENLQEDSGIRRYLLPGLYQGHPNLIICNEDEMLPTVLSLYMHNDDQSLPSRSEVLVCSEQTEIEELERFLRRAICDQRNEDRWLYALAYADKLNHSTSSKVEDVYSKLLKCGQVKEEYQLVILLTSQQHYLATCFDKYIVDGKWSQSTKQIQSYLKKHLQIADDDETITENQIKCNTMVKVVTSTRSGVGKSLYVKRVREEFEKDQDILFHSITLRLLENIINVDTIIEKLDKPEYLTNDDSTLLIHADLTPAVQYGIEAFAFNLFVLGSIQGNDGRVWKSGKNHRYLLEMTDFGTTGEKRFPNRHILNLLPCVTCCAPLDVLEGRSHHREGKERQEMDEKEFASETYQRPFQYLQRFQNGDDLDEFMYQEPQGTPRQCIEVLLHHCSISNPSWAQLRHFCSFLNTQLKNCEHSVFCTEPQVKQDLRGLKVFTVKFMIKMAQDFATPSLQISDASVRDAHAQPHRDDKQGFFAHQLRRRWEETAHPYVFFNEDKHTMTFINVKLDDNGNLVHKNGQPTNENLASPELVAALRRQRVDLRRNFDDFPRSEKLSLLCQVMGVTDDRYDPDPTYELTTDNVLKILAIYMRFRCQIPVIIMGETGCGKTRLVEFMSKLKAGRKEKRSPRASTIDSEMENGEVSYFGEIDAQNMITLKIHGGVTVQNIHKSVQSAKMRERQNRTQGNDFTVLFYDEANTTEAIYAIKEVMCDKSIDGVYFGDSNLQIVAACNPYKKLSDAVIKKLEESGLGYRIRTSETAHLFGNIPVRSLVYRVVALPPSMQPFVWDFGQLSFETEKVYIQQMTAKLIEKLNLTENNPEVSGMINTVLSSCQRYMRSLDNECRYVSLRDVERFMLAYEWFYNHQDTIYPQFEKGLTDRMEEPDREPPNIDNVVRNLIQALGVCYHASLDERKPFRERLAQCINRPGIDSKYIEEELKACQGVFLKKVGIGENIAYNEALRENVFMMAVCSDMRIPLFLIGKPGSSKSLAKTIIADKMQGQASRSPLYSKLKQIHILSYQCSALTDAKGIERVFSHCCQLQKKQDPEKYTAVVVLDEIGLAEDSPNMPLKILHPLLERRTIDLAMDGQADVPNVGFVGISNWALDPAKMNRGIFLTRNKPTKKDLRKTGKGIFKSKGKLWRINEDLLKVLTDEYLEMYMKQKVEYFGLRDYYSLMKMVCSRCVDFNADITFSDVVYTVTRNFSGGAEWVLEQLISQVRKVFSPSDIIEMPSVPIQSIILDNLKEKDSRFLLLLTNQFSAVSLLQTCLDNSAKDAQVVFGSSFPGDHSYTNVCRNINRIKVCMETGKTVILLNMANIHESLYDALNQHFVTLGGQNYVDLGLGGHRVKCRIAKEFRLIVIEKKEVVNLEYPIPLINRLEKHHFSSESLLDRKQKMDLKKLREWTASFVTSNASFTCHNAFVGFHDDTVSSVVLTTNGDTDDCKRVLLQFCCVDAVLRLPSSRLPKREVTYLQDLYFNEQNHDNLFDVLKEEILSESDISVLEISSFSSVLSKSDIDDLASKLRLTERSIIVLSLEQFNTQEEYLKRLNQFMQRCCHQNTIDSPLILLIQCAQAQSKAPLVACARHTLINRVNEEKRRLSESDRRMNVTIAVLLSAEREGKNRRKLDSLALQPTTDAKIIHVDEMKPDQDHIAPVKNFLQQTVCDVFQAGKDELGQEQFSLVNIQALLINCVCESVAKVEGHTTDNVRYLKRVQILIDLCSKDNFASVSFRKILLEKVVQLYRTLEIDNRLIRNWVVEEAKNWEHLQEGGTFRKTLWLCLKHRMSQYLAYIISKVDRMSNLDLIVKSSALHWELEMWVSMFDTVELSQDFIAKKSRFPITGRKSRNSCKFPFSFLVIDHLQEQWQALESQRCKDFQTSLIQLFRGTQMKHILDNIPEDVKDDTMKNFTSDVISILYQPGTDESKETEVVESTILSIARKSFQRISQEDRFSIGDEITLIYVTYKMLSKHLAKFSEVLQCCPQVLEKSVLWLTEQENRLTTSTDFVLHLTALKDILHLLKVKADQLQDTKVCLQWINLARSVKRLYNPVMALRSNDDDFKHLHTEWKSLSLLDLFLLQLLPPACSDDKTFHNFVNVIAPIAKLFWKGSKRTDVRSCNFLKIVLNVLKKCHSEIYLHILIDWKHPNCRICRKILGKAQEPIPLPCGHFCHEKCIRQHMSSARKCVVCNSDIPKDFVPHPIELDEGGKKMMEKMASNCTSFFQEYLQQFCFKNIPGSSSRMEEHVCLILNDVVIGKYDEGDRRELDSASLDLNINMKSCIVQTLLHHNSVFVSNKLNEALCQTDDNVRDSLITVILKVFEQRILMMSSKHEGDVEQLTQFWQSKLNEAWQKISLFDESSMSVEVIKSVAEFRCALMHFISLTNKELREIEFSRDEDLLVDEFNRLCINFLMDADVPQVIRDFVLKSGVRKFGTEWFHRLVQHDDFKVMIPLTLRQAAESSAIDHWVLLGVEYTETKTELYQTEEEYYLEKLGTIFGPNNGNFTLQAFAALSWCEKKGQDVKDMVKAVLERHGAGNNFLVRLLLERKDALKFMLEGHLPTTQQAAMIFQFLICIAMTTDVQNDIMQGFSIAINNPNRLQGCFLPAMPEDMLFATPADYRPENGQSTMYRCPRGHLYQIGECHRPIYLGRCPECQSVIGGRNHRSAEGNTRVAQSAESQAGYKFGEGANMSSGADRMSPQGAAVSKLILHSCLLIASLNHGQAVIRLLNGTNLLEAQRFLIQQLQTNLRDLSTSIARNGDDTVLVLYRILVRIINKGPTRHTENWFTLDARKAWEQKFRQKYLLPVFERLEEEITTAQAIMREAEETGSAPLTRLTQEIHGSDEPEPESPWQHESLWNIIEHPMSTHLIQVLGDQMENEGGEVLQVILQTRNLHMIKHLEVVLRIQLKLTERYQYKIDLRDSDKMTLQEHIENSEFENEDDINKYIKAWNEIFKHLEAVAPDCLQQYCEPISLDSPISTALPSIRGRGQCAKIFAEFLIDIQNNFLSRCVEVIRPVEKIKEVGVELLTSNDFVCLDKGKDLISLINSHTNYTITTDNQGRHHSIVYNIDGLEKQVREKFVLCKKLIQKNSIPCMKYPQDVGIGADWQKVAETIKQELLTAKLSQDIDRKVRGAHSSEVCEGVRTLSNAIAFLAMVKTEPKKPLWEFLEKDLKLPSMRTSIIPRSAQICHVLSLYQSISLHKATKFVQQHLDPYKEALSEIEQEEISGDLLKKTWESFKLVDVRMLQQRMNEMLITGSGIDNPEWRLTTLVFPYLSFLDKSDNESWYLRLPEELCNKHLGDLFRRSVEFLEKNQD